jgi:hypothetical protein
MLQAGGQLKAAAPKPLKGICAGFVALAIVAQLVTACADQERFQGKNTDQVKQACDPQRQSKEECARTLDR